MTTVDPNDPRSPYQQIADDLRRSITTGAIAPGERLPSTRTLAVKYGVAAMTVHQAIKLLRDENLVDSWQGRGTFVRIEGAERPQDLTSAMDELRSRVDSLTEEGAVTGEQLADLRRQLARSQAQIMELYARAGLPYPHEGEPSPAPQARRRKVSGE